MRSRLLWRSSCVKSDSRFAREITKRSKFPDMRLALKIRGTALRDKGGGGVLWSAAAERSGDAALVLNVEQRVIQSGVAAALCRRTPKVMSSTCGQESDSQRLQRHAVNGYRRHLQGLRWCG